MQVDFQQNKLRIFVCRNHRDSTSKTETRGPHHTRKRTVMIIFRRGRQKAAALLLKIRPLRHNWRFLFGIAGLTACGSSISVSNNQALTIYPVKASVSAVLSPKIDETHDNSILQVLGSFFDWLSSGLQTLLRCGALWVHFLPPVVASPLLAIQMDEINDWWWNLFRSSICNAGPTFIKFAQWAAMRPDLFHDSICLELSKLQAGAKVHSWEQTQQILRSALGENWQKHISLNEKDLLGSGCAAQVYRGTLMLSASPEEVRQEGKGGKLSASDSPRNTQEVAIKILHPNIRQLMQLDLNLMHSVAYSLECVGGFLLGFYTTNSSPALESAELSALQLYPLRCVSLSESVQEFATFMQSQLDLTQEARALDRLRNNFSGTKWRDRVIIPEPVYLLKDFSMSDGSTSSSGEHAMVPSCDVLIESFHEGVSMTDIMRSAGDNISEQVWSHNKEMAAIGLDAILKMLFEDNFVHADLHAGNILVKYASTQGTHTNPTTHNTHNVSKHTVPHPALVLLDAGLTVELRPFDRQNFVALFRAVIDNDGREVARLMMEYSPRRAVTTAPPLVVAATTSKERDPQIPQKNASAEAVTWENLVIRPEEYKSEMAALVDVVHAQGLSLGKVSVSELLRKVLQLSYEHNVKLESRFVTVVVAIMLAEGMGRRLDPDVDIIARAKPFVRSAALKMMMNNDVQQI